MSSGFGAEWEEAALRWDDEAGWGENHLSDEQCWKLLSMASQDIRGSLSPAEHAEIWRSVESLAGEWSGREDMGSTGGEQGEKGPNSERAQKRQRMEHDEGNSSGGVPRLFVSKLGAERCAAEWEVHPFDVLKAVLDDEAVVCLGEPEAEMSPPLVGEHEGIPLDGSSQMAREEEELPPTEDEARRATQLELRQRFYPLFSSRVNG